jgi:hypothetical protein
LDAALRIGYGRGGGQGERNCCLCTLSNSYS